MELDAWQDRAFQPPRRPSGEMLARAKQAPRFLCWAFEWPQASTGHCQPSCLPWGSALPCRVFVLVLTLLQLRGTLGAEESALSFLFFTLFSILCRDALILES